MQPAEATAGRPDSIEPTRGRSPIAVRDAFGANLGRVILLGLEVLIIADIIRTILVDQSLESVGVLGLIVLIRIVLSFSLEVEIDGAWPWNAWRLRSEDRAKTSNPAADG